MLDTHTHTHTAQSGIDRRTLPASLSHRTVHALDSRTRDPPQSRSADWDVQLWTDNGAMPRSAAKCRPNVVRVMLDGDINVALLFVRRQCCRSTLNLQAIIGKFGFIGLFAVSSPKTYREISI